MSHLRTRACLGAMAFLVMLSTAGGQPLRPLLLRIDGVSIEQLRKSGYLVQVEQPGQTLISLVRDTALVLATRAEAEVLRERGLRCSVLMEDTSTLRLWKRAVYGPAMNLQAPYHTTDAVVREMQSLARSYPDLVRLFTVGKTSQEQRTIYGIRITKRTSGSIPKPRVLLNGCHHGDEILGAEICLAAARELVLNYGRDPEVTRWVNSLEVVIVPVVNVDGHAVVTSGIDPRWRKNTRDTDGDGILYEFPEGVDLNRTYDFNWGHGGSDVVSSERYRGPFPFSEAETRAVSRLARENRFVLSLTYHSQGEVIYYPWDWKGRKAPDDALLTEIAVGLGSSIRTMRGDTCYKAEYGAGTVGQSYPWLYGVLGTFDFVVETGLGTPIPPPYEVPGIVQSNLAGVRHILSRAEGPGLTGRIHDATSGAPLEAEVFFPSIDSEDVHRRTSDPASGQFWRLLKPARYKCIVSKPGYAAVVLDSIAVAPGGWTTISVRLAKHSSDAE